MTSIHSNERNSGLQKFLVLWLGDFISTIGSGLTAFVLGIYAYRLTGLATSATMMVLFTFLPAFILRPIGGVLADRVNRSFLLIVGNLGSALGIVLVILSLSYRPHDLIMIYTGVALSSIFVAFQNPAFKALVTDLVPPNLYSKASGLVQLSGSAQFLVSPLLGGFLMMLMNVKYILILDALSFMISAIAVFIIRNNLKKSVKKDEVRAHFLLELLEGFQAIKANRGVLVLVFLVSILLFYIGLFQALLTPMVLSFTTARALGVSQSICAIGMLLGAIIISTHKRKNGNNVFILSVSLALLGFFYSFIGIFPSIIAVVLPGFLFFAALPFANSSLDVLVRQNISNEKQGRAWALVSVMTCFGSMVAYAISGFLADKIFNPLFMPNGRLADSLGRIFGVGPGRGIAFMFFLAGILVIILSLFIYRSKSIHMLDNEPLVKGAASDENPTD